MSHFLTLVIGDEPEKQLAKYDENLELPMHLYMTKEQLISEKRKEIEEYKKNYYDVFLQDKDAYLANCRKEHADYIENEFPKHLNWTDEQMYEDAVKYYRMDIDDGSENIEIHEDGSVWRTYNNDAKWDWYQMGGSDFYIDATADRITLSLKYYVNIIPLDGLSNHDKRIAKRYNYCVYNYDTANNVSSGFKTFRPWGGLTGSCDWSYSIDDILKSDFLTEGISVDNAIGGVFKVFLK